MTTHAMTVHVSMHGDLTGKAKQAAGAIREIVAAGRELGKLRADRFAADLDKSRKAAQGLAGDLKKISSADLAGNFSRANTQIGRMRTELASLQSMFSRVASSQNAMTSAMNRRGNSWAEREARALERLIALQSRASLNYQRMSQHRLPSPTNPRETPRPGRHTGLPHMPHSQRAHHLRRETAESAASLGHERALLRAAGHQTPQVEAFENRAREVTTRLRAGTAAEGLRMQNELTSVLGVQHAMENLDTHMRMDSILRTLMSRNTFNRGHVDQTDFTQFAVRAAEIAGRTKNHNDYEAFMDMQMRSAVASRGMVNPREWFYFMRRAGAAGMQSDSNFLRNIAPNLMQDLGGSTAGTAYATLQASMTGGQMRAKDAEAWHRLGLIPDANLTRNSRGAISGVRPNGFVGSDLLRTNYYDWVQQHMLPAMRNRGITSESDILREISGLSQNRNTRRMLAMAATEQTQFQRFRDVIDRMQDLSTTFNTLQQHDPTKNVQQFKAAWEDMLASLASPAIPAAISAMQQIGGLARSISGALSGGNGSNETNGTPGAPGNGNGGGGMGVDGVLAGGALIGAALLAKRAAGSPMARRLALAGIGGSIAGAPGAAAGWFLGGAGAAAGAAGAAGPTVARAAAMGGARAGLSTAARVGMRFLPGVGWVMLAADAAGAVSTIGEANQSLIGNVPDGTVHNARRGVMRRGNAALREAFNEDRTRQGIPQMQPLGSSVPNENLSGQGAQVIGTFQQGAQAKWGEIVAWWQSLQLPSISMRPNVTITPNVQTQGLPPAAGGGAAGGSDRPAPSLLQRQSFDSSGGGRTLHVTNSPNIHVAVGDRDGAAIARAISERFADASRTAISDVG